MRFGFRKKTPREEAADTAPVQAGEPVPLTVVLCGQPEDAAALLSALPDGSEVIARSGGPIPEADFPALRFCGAESGPNGRRVLFAGAAAWHPAAAEDFFKCLGERTEELILFRSAAAKPAGGAQCAFSPVDVPSDLPQNFAPRLYGCALSQELYQAIAPYQSGLPEEPSAVWLGTIFCRSAAFADVRLFTGQTAGPALPDGTAGVRALVESFNAFKGMLTAARYRFAFDFVCGRAVGAYAALAKARDRDGLLELDELLRSENMALRVAAAERAPLGFIDALRKHGFSVPWTAKPGIALALAAERK